MNTVLLLSLEKYDQWRFIDDRLIIILETSPISADEKKKYDFEGTYDVATVSNECAPERSTFYVYTNDKVATWWHESARWD